MLSLTEKVFTDMADVSYWCADLFLKKGRNKTVCKDSLHNISLKHKTVLKKFRTVRPKSLLGRLDALSKRI